VTPTNPLTPESVRAYLEQSERATDGEWTHSPAGLGGSVYLPNGRMVATTAYYIDAPDIWANAAFIAASRTMGPALARAWEQMRAVVKAARVVADLSLNDSPPVEQAEDASVGFYTCCGVAEYLSHRPDCWWKRRSDALDEMREALSTLTPTEER
jgi:hypothetical protein